MTALRFTMAVFFLPKVQWRNQDFRKGGGGGWYIFVIAISSLYCS